MSDSRYGNDSRYSNNSSHDIDWKPRDHMPGLEIRLAKRTVVFPWSQFVFAEGGNDEIRMAFSTHDVVITGERLDRLLPEITAQKINLLEVAGRAESFGSKFGPQITDISITKCDEGQA